MGGMGSGRRDQGGKDTTDDCRALDVRLFQRDGVLVAGRSFTTSWMRNGKAIASIQVKVEADRVILDYRHQRNGGEWKSQNYPVRIEWTPCNYGGARACLSAQRKDAVVVSPNFFLALQFLHVGTATS